MSSHTGIQGCICYTRILVYIKYVSYYADIPLYIGCEVLRG
jgi:hypothetical protein